MKKKELGKHCTTGSNQESEAVRTLRPVFLSVNYATGLQTMTFKCADCLGGSKHVYVMEKDDLLDRATANARSAVLLAAKSRLFKDLN